MTSNRLKVNVIKRELLGLLTIGNPNSLDHVLFNGEEIFPLAAAVKAASHPRKARERENAAEKTKQLMGHFGVDLQDEKEPLSNRSHREVCFHYNPTSRLYIYPWETKKSLFPDRVTSGQKDDDFKINEFVLANCLFGGALRGRDGSGNQYPMIDHNLKVQSTIENIEVDNSQLHLYEIAMFAGFYQLSKLMKRIGAEGFKVRYHLPVVDYMLYGLHSYISGVISYAAFGQYIDAVKERGKIHKKILKDLAEKNSLRLSIESPFDNFVHDINAITAERLLGLIGLDSLQLERFKDSVRGLGGPALLAKFEKRVRHKDVDLNDFKEIVDILDLLDDFQDSEQGVSASYTPYTRRIREELERICIENILKRLKGGVNTTHAGIWNTIVDKQLVTSFDPLSQLFKVANTTVLACAKEQNASGNVCSLLPVDEKPIPTAYDKYLSKYFGDIVCLSWLPPVVSVQNSPSDLEQKETSNVRNNLFRFRPDLFEVDRVEFDGQLGQLLGLDAQFWDVLEGALSSICHEIENLSRLSVFTEFNDSERKALGNGAQSCPTTIFSSDSAFYPRFSKNLNGNGGNWQPSGSNGLVVGSF